MRHRLHALIEGARKRLPAKRKLAFATIYVILGLVCAGAAFGAGTGTQYVRKVSVPAYCPDAKVAGCINEVLEALGNVVVSNTCDKTSKGFTCNLVLQGEYGASCATLLAKRAKEGFPLITGVAETTCL